MRARPSSATTSSLRRLTGTGNLARPVFTPHCETPVRPEACERLRPRVLSHFFRSKNLTPSSLRSSGRMRSSAMKRSYMLSSWRLASYCLNLVRSFSSPITCERRPQKPTRNLVGVSPVRLLPPIRRFGDRARTRVMPLTFLAARRSLYSRCGSLVIRHTSALSASSGCGAGLRGHPPKADANVHG